ncbi:MAG: ribonuclease HI [Gammaproteobacteria bacterium]|nr:ribonuclease HI [Gammaproteobacteria bacterium]MAY01647.1 ribonuclease HI [Gammaproteobacteria bacterium]|tara:strand:+ start:140938 stop:141375 length:438 start_codon:yes stop_codon:yes gene_type:complete
MRNPVIIYTDGACRGNPGPGGWGAVLQHGENLLELYGGETETTNNRMELTAVIKALEALKYPCDIQLYSDSKYVLQGISEWLANWKKRGWRTAAKKPVQNVELWQQLDALVEQQGNIQWHWVKGHSGDPGNELADQLANKGIDEL